MDALLNTGALGRMAPPVVGPLSRLSQVVRSLTQERTRESVEYCRLLASLPC